MAWTDTTTILAELVAGKRILATTHRNMTDNLQFLRDLVSVGTGEDGIVSALTATTQPWPTQLNITTPQTAKHISIIHCTGSVTITNTLTVPSSQSISTDADFYTTNFYLGSPAVSFLEGGQGREGVGGLEGSGGGTFGAGGSDGGAGGGNGGRGYGNNQNAANLYSISEIGETLIAIRGGLGGGDADVAQAVGGGAGGILVILAEGKITLTGTINCKGGDAIVGDTGGGGGGTVILASTEEIDGTGGTINCDGGTDGGFGSGSGGGGYINLMAPIVTLPTLSIANGTATNANEEGVAGAANSKLLPEDQMYKLIATVLMGASNNFNPLRTLLLDA